MRFTIDSNILVYAIDRDSTEKYTVASDLLIRAPDAEALLTVQALAEFLAVIGRKYPQYRSAARAQADRWTQIISIVATEWSHVSTAADFAIRYQLQFWDSLVWHVARSAGAEVMLSEDLQDGLALEGMTVINPFKPANAEKVARLFEET